MDNFNFFSGLACTFLWIFLFIVNFFYPQQIIVFSILKYLLFTISYTNIMYRIYNLLNNKDAQKEFMTHFNQFTQNIISLVLAVMCQFCIVFLVMYICQGLNYYIKLLI